MTREKIIEEDLKYHSCKPHEKKDLIIDFSGLTDCAPLNHALKRWLTATHGHTSHSTQRALFGSLKIFAGYLRRTKRWSGGLVSEEAYTGFVSWLNSSSRGSSAQVVARRIKCALEWCQRCVSGVISPGATFLLPRIRFHSQIPKGAPSEAEMKSYLRACYEDIEKTENCLQRGARIMADLPLDEGEANISVLLKELLVLGDGRIPKKVIVNRSGHSYASRIAKIGGHKALAKNLWLAPETIFPFYLAILIQTGGNPEALMDLQCDCVHSHPLRTDIERLKWDKSRSSSEQISDFPVGREWSAPTIVRRLRELTAPLLSRCTESDKKYLFVCYKHASDTVSKLERTSFYNELKKFAVRHGLPCRSFREFRRAIAIEHHRKTGSIFEAQKRLNHANIATTFIYSDPSGLSDQHDAVIARFQGEMVRLSKRNPNSDTKVVDNVIGAADTVFGFRCKDPLGGIAPGSRKGSVCQQFFCCATCPGALVPIDDPFVVARLLCAEAALETARRRASIENWLPRFELLYAPTLNILRREILLSVQPRIREMALCIDAERYIPELE